MPDSLRRGGIYEIRGIDLFRAMEGEESTISLIGGRDYSRVFLEVPLERDSRLSARDLKLAAFELEESRRIRLSRSLGNDPSSEGNHEFRVICFVERCLLTRPLQLQGFTVMPMSEGMGSEDEAAYINSALLALELPAQVAAERWASKMARERPIVVFDFPRIIAQTHDKAFKIAEALRDQTLDLFVLHRRARGSPLASFVQESGTDEVLSKVESQIYTGNLLGGFMSGEDPAELAGHIATVASDPLMSLFVALFRDAANERQPNFAYLRYWNLLEIVSEVYVEEDLLVTDFAGGDLFQSEKPATTNSVRGRIYYLLKSRLQSANDSEGLVVAHGPEDLWAHTAVWNGYRNAAAHHGGFRPNDPAQVAQSWYETVLAAHEESSQDGDDGLNSRFLRALRQAADLMIRWELNSGVP